ncbi:hypothetical protein BJ165DRAFT_1409143 [Panaeolus papilionaceus]|nr:hypothetical protein BJ165DRAFT_1409143 [Panaeolus papilionaceus]
MADKLDDTQVACKISHKLAAKGIFRIWRAGRPLLRIFFDTFRTIWVKTFCSEALSVKHEFRKWDDNQKDNKPKRKELSQEEHDELRVANKCFNCRDTGHQARHCPKKNNLPAPEQGSSSGPCIRNYNVEIDIEETERLHDLIHGEDTLNKFTANMIYFELDDDDQSDHGSQRDSQILSPMDLDKGSDKRPFDHEFVDYTEYMDPKYFLLYKDDPRYGPYIGDPWVAKAIAQLSHC